MTTIVIGYLTIINAIAFALMLADKARARKNLWRIPERTLFTAAILGGSVGSLLGMHLARHKTKHLKFVIGIPVILVIQVVLIVVLL